MGCAQKQEICRGVRQRGTAYLLVLGITVLLVVMGISGAILGRTAVEASNLEEDQAKARLAAQVALDVNHKRLNLDINDWRSRVTNDTWLTAETYGGATIDVKIIDEIDGVIGNDNTQRFRLYARARVGEAVRIYSVEFEPEDDSTYTRNVRSFRQETVD